MIPGDSAVETVITSGLFSTLNIYNTLLIGRLILTWFPNPPRQLAYPLATLCDPYLNLFRGIIPPIGGTIDLSPILAFTVLNVFTNTAAALPCEIGPDGEPVARARDAGRETARRWANRMKQAAARRVEEAKK
jgi:YggT family protein